MFFNIAQGTDCTGERNCVCIAPEETGTHVFWTYFKQTATGASWTFAPTLVPPSAKPSVSPVPTTSQTPSILGNGHKPSQLHHQRECTFEMGLYTSGNGDVGPLPGTTFWASPIAAASFVKGSSACESLQKQLMRHLIDELERIEN